MAPHWGHRFSENPKKPLREKKRETLKGGNIETLKGEMPEKSGTI
jgi:hypothetical protein